MKKILVLLFCTIRLYAQITTTLPPINTVSVTGKIQTQIATNIATVSSVSEASAISGTIISPTDTRYQYFSGAVGIAGNSYPNDLFVHPNYVTSQYATPGYNVEFVVNATAFELFYKATTGVYRIYLNDTLIVENTSYLNTGALLYQKITPNSGKSYRKVRIETSSDFYFGGIKISSSDALLSSLLMPKKKVIFFGDSFTEPSSTFAWNCYGHIAGKMLGVESWCSGSGSTGYATKGPYPLRYKFVDRITDITNYNPDVVVIAGGVNDAGASESQLDTEISNFMTQLKNALPTTTKIVIVENWRPKSDDVAAWNTVSYYIQKYAKANGFYFIPTRGWLTGNGYVGAENGSGNTDYYIQQDATHPTTEGHIYLGKKMAEAFIQQGILR